MCGRAGRSGSDDVGFFHSASAADLNGDGLPDVVVTDVRDPAVLYAFNNRGAGVFEREAASRWPHSLAGKPMFTVELVDVNEDGHPDALVGGHEWEGNDALVLINPGNNQFYQFNPITVPAVPGEGVILDVVVTGSGATRALWLLRTSGGNGTYYQSRTIQKIQWPSLASTIQLRERPGQWFPWLIPTALDGVPVVASEDAHVAVRIEQ